VRRATFFPLACFATLVLVSPAGHADPAADSPPRTAATPATGAVGSPLPGTGSPGGATPIAAQPVAVPRPAEDPIFAVERHRLPNGLEVFIKPRSTTRVVDVRVVVKVGFRHEAVEDSGLSHLLEHMMFKGTRRHDEIELNRIVEGKGAYANGETWPEHTFYEVNVVDRYFPLALDWLREITLESLLGAEDLEQARDDVYSEQEGDYPAFVEKLFATGVFQPLDLLVPHTLFPSMRLPERVISQLEHVDERTLREHYQRYYVPNNMAVIVVGNVDPADALARATAAFGGLEARPVEPAEYVPTLPPELPGKEIDTDLMPPVGQMTEVWRGVVTGGLNDPDRFTLRVIQTWLDRKAFEEVRSRRALGYSVGCAVQEVSDLGLLYTYARVRREGDAEDEAKRILADLFAALRDTPLPAAELQEAKDTILGRQARQLEGNAALASLYQEWFLRIPYGEPLPNYFEAVSRVTADDVQRVARERFADERMFTAVSRPTFSFVQAALSLSLLVLLLALVVVRRRLRQRREARLAAAPPVAAG
jgi:zinc protease